MSKREVVVVGAVRTGVGDFGGALKDVAPCDLAALVIRESLARAKVDPFFAQGVNAGQGALRRCAAQGILSGIPLPVFTAACAYLDGWRGAPVGANLIQAQRDLFGAHTYRRTDREGVFHHEWRRDNG